jgi:hypothetical protein|nr:MAG TPA: hypothetical protein [Caudoviricetes sp.]
MKKYLILLFTIFSFSIFAEKSNVVLDIQKLSKYFKTSKIQNIEGGLISIKKPNVSITISFLDEDHFESYKEDAIRQLTVEDDYYIFDERENIITFLKDKTICIIKTDKNVNMQFTIIAPISYLTKNIAQKDMQNIYNAVEDSDY